MPYCQVSNFGTKIFYRRYGHGSTKVLLIIGLAATHEAWGPQVKGLAGTTEPSDVEGAPTVAVDLGSDGCDHEEGHGVDGIEVCCFDNRGVGRSSIPNKKSEYTTTIMAKDALALLDHLGWSKAHVFGHSMGSMIACKLAAIAPDRLLSLALLNATGGGYECFPRIDSQMISLAFRFLRAKTPEQRAAVDLETHYTKEYLDECVGLSTRRRMLHQEYVKAISSSGMQSTSGFEGQVNACWTHKMTSKELDMIRASGFLISVIHGRYDIIAQLCHAKKLAQKLQPAARMVEVHGGHLVSHERPNEVNQSLMDLINASNAKIQPQEWSNLKESRLVTRTPITLSCIRNSGNLLGKLQLIFLYLLGLFIMVFEHMRNIIRAVKPVRMLATN